MWSYPLYIRFVDGAVVVLFEWQNYWVLIAACLAVAYKGYKEYRKSYESRNQFWQVQD